MHKGIQGKNAMRITGVANGQFGRLFQSVFAVSGLIVAVLASNGALAASFETEPVFSASRILPPVLVAGPEHQVAPRVRNDGVMNLYEINSRFGIFKAKSTEELRIRIREIYAIAEMNKIESSEAFKSGIKNAGAGVVEGVGSAVTDPIGTASGAISGVGKLFRRAGANLSGDNPRSDAEGGLMKELAGVEQRKREYAAKLGIDVYSTNEVLQEQLDRLARAGALGGIGIGFSVGAVAGPVIAATQSANLMNDVFAAKSATDLRIMNRAALEGMGVSKEVIDRFFANPVISPRHQTIIVRSLQNMGGTKGREHLLKLAILSDFEDIALFRQRQAELYSAYSNGVERIVRFQPFGQIVAAETSSGSHLFIWPVDYLSWTRDVSRLVNWGNDQVEKTGKAKKKRVWLAGSATDRVLDELTRLGWEIERDAARRLNVRN